MAAVASIVDSYPEDRIPASQRVVFHRFRLAFNEAFAGADGLADESGAMPPGPAKPLPADVAAVYDHLAANLRWPPGYGRDHKLATIHAMLGKPATAAEAQANAAVWYHANNEGDVADVA